MSSTIRVEAIPTRPLSTLSPSSPVYVNQQPAEVLVEERVYVEPKKSMNWFGWIVCLIILTVIISLLLYVFNPTAIQEKDAAGNPNGVQSWSMIIFYALFFALLLMILAYAFRAKY